MNIELRTRTESHVRIYFEKTQDSEIQHLMPQAVQNIAHALENYQKTKLPGATSYGKTIYLDGVYIGDIWCYCIDPNGAPNAMVSYCIFDKSHWNKGAATKALALFLVELIQKFRFHTIGAFSYSFNHASVQVLLKNGFIEQETFTENGIESKYFVLHT